MLNGGFPKASKKLTSISLRETQNYAPYSSFSQVINNRCLRCCRVHSTLSPPPFITRGEPRLKASSLISGPLVESCEFMNLGGRLLCDDLRPIKELSNSEIPPSFAWIFVIIDPPNVLPALFLKNVVLRRLLASFLFSKIPNSLGSKYVPGPGVPS